jgi:hypothetical protein
MAREDFIHNLRLADLSLSPHPPRVSADSPYVDVDEFARALVRGDPWLTPKLLEGFAPDDFSDLAPKQQKDLKQAVDRFLAIAQKVPSAGPATREQAERARPQLERIIAIVGETVLAEWKAALEELIQKVETWSRHQDWAVKRDTKRITEELLGTYDAPRLLIHTLDGRLLLVPVTRFAVGCDGLVEFCVMPSFDSASIVRSKNVWYLQPLRPQGRRAVFSEETFVKTARDLLQNA